MDRRFTRLRRQLSLVTLLLATSGSPVAQDHMGDDLFDLSLDELMNITVTSVSKQEETLATAAAAAYVITQDDLRRMGVTNIADALRAVPGVQVSQMDGQTWAVSVRGFNRQFSNKLLVLMDGRTVYTPLFSGVWWDAQDTFLDDIDRIEVIRGPGGALWGANAVNGVINIITKSAAETQGVQADVAAGTQLRAMAQARQGIELGDKGHLRYYAKLTDWDENEVHNPAPGSDNDLGDDWQSARAGFRWDWSNKRDEHTLQGDVYQLDKNQDIVVPTLTPPFSYGEATHQEATGAYLLGRWSREYLNGGGHSFQAYYDYVEREAEVLDLEIYTVDLDFQQTVPLNDRNELIWGGGYRYVSDELDEQEIVGTVYLDYQPDERSDDIFSAFVQNKFSIRPEELVLTLGSKFEHNDYTGFEVQPNARLAWYPRQGQMVWGAVSRAVRTPTRGEHGLDLRGGVIPGAGFIAQIDDGDNFDSEDLIAYELGYRRDVGTRATLDATVFYHDYEDVRTFDPIPPFDDIIVPLQVGNDASAESYGLELAGNWSPTDVWRLSAAYSYLDVNVTLDSGSADPLAELDETNHPTHQFNIRSYWSPTAAWNFDGALYYVDELRQIDSAGTDIPSYWRLDMRAAWKPVKEWELSVVGQNLLDDEHPEFAAPLASRRGDIRRNIYVRISYAF